MTNPESEKENFEPLVSAMLGLLLFFIRVWAVLYAWNALLAPLADFPRIGFWEAFALAIVVGLLNPYRRA